MQVVSCPVMNICMCFEATVSLLTVRPIFMPLKGVVFLGKLHVKFAPLSFREDLFKC